MPPKGWRKPRPDNQPKGRRLGPRPSKRMLTELSQIETEQAGDAPAGEPAVVEAAPPPPPAAEYASIIDHAYAECPIGSEALGQLAKAIVGNTAVGEAFKRAEREILKDWAATELLEADKRESLYHDLRALAALKSSLDRLSSAGRIARINRERLNVA